MEHVFSLSFADNYPVYEGVELDDGRYAVIRLNGIVSVPESDAKIDMAEWISVQGEYGRREMLAMLQALRETGDVVLFSENL